MGDIIMFPLRGPEADVCMAIEGLVAFMCVEIFLHFFYRYFKDHNIGENERNLAYSFLFLGLGVAYLFYLHSDYIVESSEERTEYVFFGYASLCSGVFLFFLISERMERSSKYPFTVITGVILGVVFISFLTSFRGIVIMISYIVGFPLAILYSIRYFRKLIKEINYHRATVLKIIWLGGCIGSIICGVLFSGDYFLQKYGFMSRMASGLAILMGLYVFFQIMGNLPDYQDVYYSKRIQALVLLKDTGLPLYTRIFGQKIEELELMPLISGIFSSIQIVASQLSKNSIKKVESEGKFILFQFIPEHEIYLCLIVDDYAPSLNSRMRMFLGQFVKLFGEILPMWDGDTNIFKSLDTVCDEIFTPLLNLE